MQIILPGWFVVSPGRTAKGTLPIIWRRAVGLGTTPHVPVAFGIIPRGSGFFKPRMLVGSVVEYEVDNNFQLTPMSPVQKALKVVECTENRVYIAIIRHFIAKIGHGRGIKRR